MSFGVHPRSSVLLTAAAIALSACTLVPAARAAAPAEPGSGSSTGGTASASPFRVDTALVAPLEDVQYRTAGISSSSLVSPLEDERMNLSADGIAGEGAGQPANGKRRRSYGKSRYQDRLHNSDGSNKIAVLAGGAIAIPVGNTGKYYTPSYAIEAGAGWNFNKTFGVLGEFHYDHLGLTGGSINYEYNLYLNSGATATQLAGFDANAHIIALTVNPIVNFPAGKDSKLGGYVTGGFGYYRKSTNFTLPQLGYGYYGNIISQNVNITTDTANSLGTNFGVGFTYKLSEFSSERLFAEARYNWLSINSGNAANDAFIYNRRNSEYVPVEVGIRF